MPQFPFTRSSRKGTLTSAAFVLAGITAAALATGACIVGILCLPLILLLVYKQRQVASHRRKYCPLGVQGWEASEGLGLEACTVLLHSSCQELALWLREKGLSLGLTPANCFGTQAEWVWHSPCESIGGHTEGRG